VQVKTKIKSPIRALWTCVTAQNGYSRTGGTLDNRTDIEFVRSSEADTSVSRDIKGKRSVSVKSLGDEGDRRLEGKEIT
jgi:carbon monoxide dehydrogenase subunit G